MFAIGSYGSTVANRAFIFGVQSDEKPRFRFYDNSGSSDAEIIFPVNTTNDNEWHLLTATYDFATETATGYIDGRDVTAASTVTAGTNGSTNTSQDPDDFTIGSLISSPPSYDWNGQLQQPLIYNGVWTAAEVRDLYLQQTDDIPTTYGWFLDSDSAHGLTSASPALTPSNSPALYEDDAVPVDWLNEKGYNSQISFQGNGTDVTLNLGDVRIPAADHTLSFWYFNTGGTSAQRVVDARITGGFYIVILNNSVNGRLTFYGKTSAKEDIADAVIDNAWHYFEIVQSGSTVTCTVTKPDGTTKSSARTIEIDDITASPVYFLGGYNLNGNPRYGNGTDGRVARIQLTTGGVTTQIEPIANSRSVIKNVDGVETTIEDAITGGTVSTLLTTDPIPKRWDEELDSIGLAADNSNSFGVARRSWQLTDGACISLDGVNQHGTLPSEVSTVLSEANSFTVSMDFVCDDILSDTRQTLITNGADTLDRFTVQILSNGGIRASVYDGVFYSVSSANSAIVNGEVNNFVCSWNGSEIKLWLNDVEIDNGTDSTSTISGGGVFIGQSAGSFWDGQLWNLKIYNSSIAAISDLDSLTATHHYPMAEGSGDVSYDVSGNGKDCTWQNSPIWGNQSNYFWNENKGCSWKQLVSNGGFDSADDWILEGGATISGGQAHFSGGASERVRQNILTIGETYTVEVEVTSLTSGAVAVQTGTTITPLPAEVGVHRVTEVANGATLFGVRNSGAVASIDNVKVWHTSTLVPALADGSNTDANGYELTNPAGPWLYEGLGSTYVNFDVVANANQWLEQRWQDTEGDGVGYLTLDDEITLSGAFDIEFLLTTSDTVGAVISKSSIGSVPKILFYNPNIFIRVVSSTSPDITVAQPSSGVEHSYKLSRDSSGVVTLTIDGTSNTLFGGAAQVGTMELQDILAANGGAILSGTLRNLKITDAGTTVLDFAPLLDLDLSSSLNNTTEAVAGVTYNRLTDLSYTAGDAVEQPFSVSTTGNKVYDLVKFTFPVTD
jgi:hypothetical protein